MCDILTIYYVCYDGSVRLLQKQEHLGFLRPGPKMTRAGQQGSIYIFTVLLCLQRYCFV